MRSSEAYDEAKFIENNSVILREEDLGDDELENWEYASSNGLLVEEE